MVFDDLRGGLGIEDAPEAFREGTCKPPEPFTIA